MDSICVIFSSIWKVINIGIVALELLLSCGDVWILAQSLKIVSCWQSFWPPINSDRLLMFYNLLHTHTVFRFTNVTLLEKSQDPSELCVESFDRIWTLASVFFFAALLLTHFSGLCHQSFHFLLSYHLYMKGYWGLCFSISPLWCFLFLQFHQWNLKIARFLWTVPMYLLFFEYIRHHCFQCSPYILLIHQTPWRSFPSILW